MILNLITKAKELLYKNGKNVEEALDEVNSNLELKTVTITKATNDYAEIYDNNTYCYVKNGICYLQLAVTIKQTYGGWAKIGTIPYKPVDTEVLFNVGSAYRTKQAYLRVDTKGNLYSFPNDNASFVDIGNVAFPCKPIS